MHRHTQRRPAGRSSQAYTDPVTDDSNGAQMTTASVAAVLGVSAQNLRRWIREGKFEQLPGLDWARRPGFQKQRTYTHTWIEGAATILGVTPDWSRM